MKIGKLYFRFRNFLKYGTGDMFYRVEIETTTICNRKCPYCPISKYPRKKTFMSEKLFKKIINDLAKIDFSGDISPHNFGEPLLDKRLPGFINYVRSKLSKARIIVYTNGDFLPDQFDTLIKSGVDRFNVTQHDKKIPEKMKHFLESLDDKNRRMIKYGKIHKFSNRTGLIKLENTELIKNCDRPNRILTIDHEGNVILCCNDYFSTVKFGNVGKENLMSIWNKKEYRTVRKQKNKADILEICRKCKVQKDF